MRVIAICLVVVSQLTLFSVGQQGASTGTTAEAVCTFEDGKEMKVQYSSAPATRHEDFHEGRLWEPGGSPMFLFTQTALTVGGSVIPAGAYSLYLIPEKHAWTLVVNRNVAAGSKYDEKQDLGRAAMQVAENESSVKQVQIVLAHMAPKQCNLRLYYEKAGVWTEFREK